MVLTDRRPAAPHRATPRAPRTPARVAPGRVARRPAPPTPWLRAGLGFSALVAAYSGLHVLLQEWSWWIVGVLVALVVFAASALARTVWRREWPAPFVGAAAGLGVLVFSYAAESAIFGVVPTLDSVARFGVLAAEGIESIVDQRVPATPELGIVFLLAVMTIASAWFIDLAFAVRAPALAALPLGGILAIPTFIKPGLIDAWWFVVTAIVYLAILRWRRRPDSRRVVLVVGAATVVGALIMPSTIPPVRESTGSPVAGLQTGVNPIISLGADLRRGDPVLALTYTSTASDPVYLRFTTLDTFTGETWTPRIGNIGGYRSVESFDAPPGLASAIPRTEVSAQVDISGVSSRWLPVPYPAVRIEGLVGQWVWEQEGRAVRSPDTGAQAQEYRVDFLEVAPTAAQLAATEARAGDTRTSSLRLPDDLPDIVVDTARSLEQRGASAYDTALALQRYLRSSPFEYSETAPVEQGFDGTGMDALAAFLEQKTGYCVHYASAMAVMARVLGIPSRVAVGFQPGEGALVEGDRVFTVMSSDLHAWPELYFDGIGWLRFEPTPSRGAVPVYGVDPVDDPATPEDESDPTPEPGDAATPGAVADRLDEQDAATAAAAAREAAPTLALTIALAALVVLFTPAGFRAGIRALRLRRMRRGQGAAEAAWAELRDTARDHGWSAPDSETPRALAVRLEESLGGAAPLRALRSQVEASAFAREAPPPSIAELRAVRRTIVRASDVRTRIRVFFLPPSLRDRWRVEAD